VRLYIARVSRSMLLKPQLPSVKEGITSYQMISNGSSSWQRCLAVAECHEGKPFQIPRAQRDLFLDVFF